MKISTALCAALIAMPVLIPPSVAAERESRRGNERERREVWHGEIHRFHEHDLGLWRGGRWVQGRHEGRSGWWWIVGGVWYHYPTPVYPYPDPYQPPVVVVPPAPSSPQYWYYCTNPAGYYPYVAQCGTNWQRVPATPSPAAPASTPSAPPPAPAPAAEQYWYYCTNPPGYYPTVAQCETPWQRVPANVPAGPPPSAPLPPNPR